jgi:hypothetical protein
VIFGTEEVQKAVVCTECVACESIFGECSELRKVERNCRLHAYLKFLCCESTTLPRRVTLFMWCLEHLSKSTLEEAPEIIIDDEENPAPAVAILSPSAK